MKLFIISAALLLLGALCVDAGASAANCKKFKKQCDKGKVPACRKVERQCTGTGKKKNNPSPAGISDCPTSCAGVAKLKVCGTNGRTYTNECLLRREKCRRGSNLEVAYIGKCTANRPAGQTAGGGGSSSGSNEEPEQPEQPEGSEQEGSIPAGVILPMGGSGRGQGRGQGSQGNQGGEEEEPEEPEQEEPEQEEPEGSQGVPAGVILPIGPADRGQGRGQGGQGNQGEQGEPEESEQEESEQPEEPEQQEAPEQEESEQEESEQEESEQEESEQEESEGAQGDPARVILPIGRGSGQRGQWRGQSGQGEQEEPEEQEESEQEEPEDPEEPEGNAPSRVILGGGGRGQRRGQGGRRNQGNSGDSSESEEEEESEGETAPVAGSVDQAVPSETDPVVAAQPSEADPGRTGINAFPDFP